jgi:phage gpG-like protein
MPEAFSYSIEIKGLEELMNKLTASVREDVIKRSLYQGGLLLAGWSKKNRLSGPRPQFLGVVTGRLRSSITASPTEHIGSEYRVRIDTNVEYGPTHEFGSLSRNIPARPFLRPALEDEGNRSMVLNILTENINLALENK